MDFSPVGPWLEERLARRAPRPPLRLIEDHPLWQGLLLCVPLLRDFRDLSPFRRTGSTTNPLPYRAGPEIGAFAGSFTAAADTRLAFTDADLDPSEVSVSCLCYGDTFPSDATIARTTSAGATKWDLDVNNGINLRWFIGSSSANIEVSLSSLGITTNQWFQAGGTAKTDDFRLFHNGRQVGIDTAGTFASGWSGIYIGHEPPTSDEWDGMLANFCLWGRVLSAAEMELAGEPETWWSLYEPDRTFVAVPAAAAGTRLSSMLLLGVGR